MFDAQLEVQNVGVDPRNRGFERPIAGARGIIANKTPETRRPKRATECACHRCQCQHGRKCCQPRLAEHSGALPGLRFPANVVIAVPVAIAG